MFLTRRSSATIHAAAYHRDRIQQVWRGAKRALTSIGTAGQAALLIAGLALIQFLENRYLALFGLPGLLLDGPLTSVSALLLATAFLGFLLLLAVLWFIPWFEEWMGSGIESFTSAVLRITLMLVLWLGIYHQSASVDLLGPACLAASWVILLGDFYLRRRSRRMVCSRTTLDFALVSLMIPFMTLSWLTLCLSVWTAIFRDLFETGPQVLAYLPDLVAVSAAIVYLLGRAGYWQIFCICILPAPLLFATSLLSLNALTQATFWQINAGGGRVDLIATGSGPPLCDMGLFGQHFYVEAGPSGCTANAAAKLVRQLETLSEAERLKRLIQIRREPYPKAQGNSATK